MSAPPLWQADPTSTSPASYTTTAQEDCTLAFDTTALLVSAGAPSGPTSLLFQVVNNGADVAVELADDPTVNANIISQRLRGLTAGVIYKLRIAFVTSGNTRAMTTVIIVVE